jgi:hypothetical protein
MFGDCYCDIYSGDYEPIENYSQYMTVARRNYRCIECRELIKAGVKHEAVTGSFYNEIVNYRTCCRCKTIREDFGFCVHGILWEDLQETWEEDSHLLGIGDKDEFRTARI